MLRRVIESDECYIINSINRIYSLTDTQWDFIKDFLQGRARHVDAPSKNNRLFVDAVLYHYRAASYGETCLSALAISASFIRDICAGVYLSSVWQRVFETLSCQADNEYATIVRTHQHNADAKGGIENHTSGAAEEA